MIFRRIAIGLTVIALSTSPLVAGERIVAGWIEKVRLYPGGIEMHAKLDTGARNSSINAPNKEVFDRNGRKWVRFSVTNRDGAMALFERPVTREARVRRAGTERDIRSVIELGICLGSIRREVEVNLTNRKGMKYQLLLGRSFMGDVVLVDSALTYTKKPDCEKKDGPK